MKIDPIWQADIQQQIFRNVLEAFSRPGTSQILSGLINTHHASVAVLAAILDRQVTLADPHNLLESSLWPLLQASRNAATSANFILADGALAPDFEPCLGTLDSPELGATLVVCVEKISAGKQIQLNGPGVDGTTAFSALGLSPEWLEKRNEWTYSFPLGVDLVLTDSTSIVVIPRSTQLLLSEDVT